MSSSESLRREGAVVRAQQLAYDIVACCLNMCLLEKAHIL